MPNGGSLLTLTFGGATRWVPSYNVMGVAKAALEASVRYLAADLGPQGIRVNALSAGPMRTLAGAGISDARVHLQLPERARAAAAHADARRGRRRRRSTCCPTCRARVTGEVHFVDCGYNTVAMPSLEVAEDDRAGRHRCRPHAKGRVAYRTTSAST